MRIRFVFFGLALGASGCSTPSLSTPDLGATVSAADPPPALSGGTLMVTHDGARAFAADPDRDRVYVVDLARRSVAATVTLRNGDEPGRVVEDGAGVAHVVLRRAGAVIDVSRDGTVLRRRDVCPAPRGIAWSAARDTLFVACAGGEVYTLASAGGDAVRVATLEPDLRDVVIDRGAVYVSTFRTARLLRVDTSTMPMSATLAAMPTTLVEQRVRFVSRGHTENFEAPFVPEVAWRTVNRPGGGVVMLHQRAQSTATGPQSQPSGWGGGPIGCGVCSCSPVHTTITSWSDMNQTPPAAPIVPEATVPLDLAFAPDGNSASVIAAGNAHVPGESQILTFATSAVIAGSGCAAPSPAPRQPPGEATALVYAPDGALIVQLREPGSLFFASDGSSLRLSDVSRADTGLALFHANAGGFVACASCHPEGGDDGHVWTFADVGARRTMPLQGGILATAPFHWDGALPDLQTLMDAVFTQRMGGPAVAGGQVAALSHWLDHVPAAATIPLVDANAVDHGRAIFERADVGCASCHSGPRFTNNATTDVGTGGSFQVPSLNGLSQRGPYLHNGCAATLLDRFGTCGGGDAHGHTSQLLPGDLADLVAYLRTL